MGSERGEAMTGTARVILHNHCTAIIEIEEWAVPYMEREIEKRLRSSEPLPWRNDPQGVKVDLVLETGVKQPRWRFFLDKDDGVLANDNEGEEPE
jgi:hypothetical protein